MDKALEQQGYLTTTVDAVVGWARSNSIMPMPLGLSCCAIEMMATAGPRYDQGRFGEKAPKPCMRYNIQAGQFSQALVRRWAFGYG